MPTLILGAGQRQSADSFPSATVTRRGSGGTAVLATPSVLGLDVLLPRGHRLAIADVVEGYRWLGDCWAEALRRLGLDARVVGVDEARAACPPPPDLAEGIKLACFGSLSPYEVVVGGRKVVGLAQIRRRNVLLQAGVHFRFDAATLARHLARDRADALTRELERRAAGLVDLGLAHVDCNTVMEMFASVLLDRQGVELCPGGWTGAELETAGPA